MSPDTHGAAPVDDPLYLVAVAVRSRSGAWIGVENLAGECCLYLQGHRVRPTQIRALYSMTPAQPVYITGIHGNAITVEVNGGTWRFRSRDPASLQAAVERHGAAAQLRGTLLSIPNADIEYAFNLKPAEEQWSECR